MYRSGIGYKVNESLAVGGNRTQAAQAAWVGYPSSCTWTATGAGDSTTYTEVVTTAPAPATKPTINVSRSPAPVAGQSFTTSWSTSNATSLSRVCTASGSGYTVNESLSLNGSRSDTAQAAWVGYPSSCTWTANGTGGTTSYTETMTTAAATTPKPTISVTRNPAPVAGQSFTTTWSTSNASSLSRVCTASGTGYTVNETLVVNGSRTDTASAAWVGYPSSCTWTASGAGGTSTHVETMTTTAPVSSGVTYIHTDGLGSPVARTNAAGQVISRTRYEPYGYVADGAQPTVGFTGHVNDADTGLTYMQQRYYDPAAGRFLSIDPVITDANTGGSFNRYAYAENNPFRYIDPDGRAADSITMDKNGNVNIVMGITYKGNVTVAQATAWNAAIIQKWSGKFGPYTVKMTIIPGSAAKFGNIIEVVNGHKLATSTNGGSLVTMYTSSPRGTFVQVLQHEVMHLIGTASRRGDRYDDGVAHSGWEGNIAADPAGSVDSRNIEDMIKRDRPHLPAKSTSGTGSNAALPNGPQGCMAPGGNCWN